MRKYVIIIGILLLTSLGLCACSRTSKPSEEHPFTVYYLSTNGKGLTEVGYSPSAVTTDSLIRELIGQLQVSGSDRIAPISDSVMYKDMTFADGIVTVTFQSYRVDDVLREVLIRAAIVRTLCGPEAVDGVVFRVEGADLPPTEEVMRKEQFVTTLDTPSEPFLLKLYFLSESGTELVEAERPVVLDDIKRREQYLLEILIAGPIASEEGAISCIPAKTKILSVNTRDGICSVNLSKEFVSDKKNVPANLVIQSIADTLIVNLDYIDGVVISVDGKRLTTYGTYEVPGILRRQENEP
ncbi:MAG: GerMN domain-containing protein [Lachnospiraceae bacterium]|nr:GerMN domain-containing protein [Lachnospiraceae bacterium]